MCGGRLFPAQVLSISIDINQVYLDTQYDHYPTEFHHMKYNLKCIVQHCAVVLIFSLMQVKPVYAQDVSENMLSDSSITVINSILHAPRFVQNSGQWPSDIHYVARTGDGYIAFMTDSIVVHRFDDVMLAEPEDDEESAIATGTLLSRKQSRPVSAVQASRTLETRISVLLKQTGGEHLTPIVLGQRLERFNFFPGGSVGTSAVQSPSFDTLVYRSVRPGYDLMIITRNAQFQCMIVPRNAASEEYDDNLPDDLGTLLTFLRNIEPPPKVEARGFSAHGRILYSTLLGGESQDGIMCLVPIRENIFVLVGSTRSTQFPITDNAFDRNFRGDTSSIYGRQIFITCMNIDAGELTFSTFFGGTDLESVLSAEVRNDGVIVFAGSTWSDDLPTTEGAYQRQYRGNGDGYIAAIDSTGSRLIFCTYIGGSGIENLKDMKIDDEGNIVVTGLTDSWNFPTTPGVLQRNYGGGDDDIFVAKFNSDASQLLFSTYIGGSGWDEGYNLQLLGERGILISGATNSDNFPVTPDALYPSRLGYDEGCVLILSNDGRKLVYSTYIAWDAHENVWDAFLDNNDVFTIHGITTSTNLPTSSASFQQRKGGYPVYNQLSADYYILRFALGSSETLACTYIGGAGSERYARQFRLLPDGNLLVGGVSPSIDYPVTDTLLRGSPTRESLVVSIIDSTLSILLYGVRFGGSDYSFLGSAHFFDGALLLSGATYSTDFPLTTNAWQTEYKGVGDGYFTMLDISDFVTGTSPPTPASATDLLYSAYPNPAARSVTLPFTLASAGHVRITIHDMLGRVVGTALDSFLSEGEHKHIFDTAPLPSGTYIVRMLSERGQQAKVLQVLRR
jgi:hypothetical protein